MLNNHQRPAKRVLFSQEDISIITNNGGGDAKFFKAVTEEFVNGLIIKVENSVANLSESTLEAFLMVVELEPEALAKSHRPVSIFNDTTCPFIGDIGVEHESKVGRFLIKATSEGLYKLRDRISSVTGKNPSAALSTIRDIRLFSPTFNIEKLKSEKSFFIRLIYLEDEGLDKNIEILFNKLVQKYQLYAHKIVSNMPMYHLHIDNELLAYNFLTKLKENSTVFSIHSTKVTGIMPNTSMQDKDHGVTLEVPDGEVDYPIVGVVDSSINSSCKYIAPWFVGEESAIIEEDKDYSHGTFVAGLITNARNLNNNRKDFPQSKSKVFSVGVLDLNGGDMYVIHEMMIRAQEERTDIKVWNLSLGSTEPVSLDRISEFAILLDEFQKKYGCLCIISAGNINNSDYHRTWPPEEGRYPLDEQRITSPGDSVLGLTIASVAHENGIVKINEPSIFSRSGPVANLVLKPDLSHYGGNHANGESGVIPIGITSISADSCQFRQDCGTSFSTPLVSTIAANLWKNMGYDTKRHTIKGLLAHSARLNSEIDNEHKVYYGWGMPLDSQDFMYCKENEITMIMEGDIGSNVEVVGKLPFPMPDSLRTEDGKIKGEIFMTISYDSPLDSNRALEYCLVNIEVGLGEVLESGEFSGKVPAENTGFEQDLVNGRYKWSPVKVYHKKFPRGVDVENWKLQVKMLTREGFNPSDDFRLPFTIILTIRALEPEAQIYDEMVRLMNQFNWEVSNAIIPIEPQIEI